MYSILPSITPSQALYNQSSTSISGTPATIVWTSTIFQVGAGSMSNRIFTIGIDGLYFVEAKVRVTGTFSSNQQISLLLVVNSVTQTLCLTRTIAAPTDVCAYCTDVFKLVGGDQVSAQISGTGSVMNFVNDSVEPTFEIIKVA